MNLRVLSRRENSKLLQTSFVLLAVGLVITPLVAQQDDLETLSNRADAELTSAYKNCLAQYPPNLKEQLRIAERAWIAYTDKNEAAAALAGKRRGLFKDDLWREGLGEVNARAQELRSFFVLPNQDLQSCQQDWQKADGELTAAYSTAIGALAIDEQKKLREAERAWIEYRDKDARAHLGDPSGRAPVWDAVVLTRRRSEELQFFTRLGGMAASTPSSTPVPTPTPTPLDPAVRAKLAADFHANVTQLLAKANNQSWLKIHPTSLDKISALPTDLADAVRKAADDASEFRRKVGYDEKSLNDFKDDTAIVDSLKAYAASADQLHSGNAVQASETLDSFHQEYPDAPGTESKALWEAVDSIRSLLDRLHNESEADIEKASALSDAGKTGNAVQEYQKAYQTFPDPGVAEQITKLREESLGL